MSCGLFKNVVKYGEYGFTYSYKEQLLLFQIFLTKGVFHDEYFL